MAKPGTPQAPVMESGQLHRIAAFTADPHGGNPAGVWIGEELPASKEMQRIAAEVGYSETAFVAPTRGLQRTVRYFSPETEVPFCGHATIASGFVLGSRGDETTYSFSTPAGVVPVRVQSVDDRTMISLTSVDTRYRNVEAPLLDKFLAALRWKKHDLDASIAPALAFAGAWHLVLAVAGRDRLATLDYDFDAALSLMRQEQLTTLQLIWREKDDQIHSRNPFPPGGVIEDPATGAAAAALGGYLRDAGYVVTPFDLVVNQGEDMGRPGRIDVSIPVSGGITVSGTAVRIP